MESVHYGTSNLINWIFVYLKGRMVEFCYCLDDMTRMLEDTKYRVVLSSPTLGSRYLTYHKCVHCRMVYEIYLNVDYDTLYCYAHEDKFTYPLRYHCVTMRQTFVKLCNHLGIDIPSDEPDDDIVLTQSKVFDAENLFP